MIAWKPFVHAGTTYSLEHLHPCVMTFVQPPTNGKSVREYRIRVFYTLHCFTRGRKTGDAESRMTYSDHRETRIFDVNRYLWSRQLPRIVSQLPASRCFHTNHGNFLAIARIDHLGRTQDYEVYFNAARSKQSGMDLDLDIASAYVRYDSHPKRPKRKPVGFFVILYNRLANRSLAPPR